MYLLQLASSIRATGLAVVNDNDTFLQDELERAQRIYIEKTGSRYPTMPASSRTRTKGQLP